LKPPSSDGPKKAKRTHLPTGKKPGGQPGPPPSVSVHALPDFPAAELGLGILSMRSNHCLKAICEQSDPRMAACSGCATP
jgi:hypothetical protein